ncbi:hypothetical protein C1645_734195 [Glomus cerebriforme]|uniref:SAM domain-containing protein n=1 Tax=Glomus cerebriforme TaxID=658196 RepID=A0A397TBF5_9GLOM|nr:hypothetical protein C1645_734195 [Glomus cerebriforme]
MSDSTTETDSSLIENWDTEDLIDFLKKLDFKLDEDDFTILRKKKIKGRSFLLMDEEKLERCGLEMGPALLLAEVIKSLKENKKHLFLSSKKILAKYNIDGNGIDSICQCPPSDDKELQRNVRETKGKDKELQQNVRETKGEDKELQQNVRETKGEDKELQQDVKETKGDDKELQQNVGETKEDKKLQQNVRETKGEDKELQQNVKETKDDDKELQQNVRETKLEMREQETNNITSTTISLRSISTQTINISADPESLTYLIQGLISRSLSHFPLDERLIFISGKTEGVCKISSVDPRLSSVSFFCEYKLGNTYIHQPPPEFSGYPISLKSSFSSIGKIITGLDRSKTKFIDNINYVIEFVEMFEVEEFIKSGLNISNPSTGETSASPQNRAVTIQTEPYIEDKKALTYIAKGIMFKSICWFTWDEHEAFIFGKKEGILQLISADPKLARMTLTCNYKLSKRLLNFQGDIGYPMIVSCSYGSVKTLLTHDRKKIMDNFNYKLTFLS